MQFSRTFIVEDSQPMVHHELGMLLREAGYKLLQDGYYQRGTPEGSMLLFDPSQWYTRLLADTSSTPEFYTKIVLSYDVQTAGQTLTNPIRKFWNDEVDGFVTRLGGRVDSARDTLSMDLDLGSLPPETAENPQAGWLVSPTRSNDLTSTQDTERAEHERRMKNGANWFFWIAGLSLFNSIIYLLNADFSFSFSLDATQIVNWFAAALIQDIPMGLVYLRVLAVVINLAIMAIFTGFGLLARKGTGWAFLSGMALYFLDGLMFLWAADWFAVIFHGIVLYGLIRGYMARRALSKLQVAFGNFTN